MSAFNHTTSAGRSSSVAVATSWASHTVTSRLVACALCLIVWSCAATVSAEVRRYALVIGTNLGEPDEQELRYAERDARRVSQVLGRLGGIPEENRVLLLDADSASVERVLNDLNERIAAFEAAHSRHETLLFVFYSGHADAGAMHLRGTRLSFERMRELLGGSPADLKVFVIDACRSGGVTRVKGASPAAPFKIDVKERLAGEGMAIITSSAEGEDAQESDRLQGSFFTHHFVSGLLGAADLSGDRRVTLGEVYQYAYNETLRSTSRARFIQHPTYAFQIRGRQDVVLTSLEGSARGVSQVKLLDPGTYVIFRDSDKGALVAEVAVDQRAQVSLEPGRYLIRHRGEGVIHQMLTRLKDGQSISVGLDEMQPVPYGQVVRKGLDPGGGSSLALSAGVVSSFGPVQGAGVMHLANLGMQVDWQSLTLQARLRGGRSFEENGFIEIEQRALGLDVGALKLFDVGPVALGVGLRVGADRVWQRFETSGDAPPRRAGLLRTGAVVHAAWSITSAWSLALEGGGEAVFYQAADSVEEDPTWQARLVPFVGLGLVYHAF